MIVKTYRCDLCHQDCEYPKGGHRLRFSGCGGITPQWLDDHNASESIICKNCLRGLRHAISTTPDSPDASY